MKRLLAIAAAVILAACSTPPNYAKLQQMQAEAQAVVSVACAGIDTAAPSFGTVNASVAQAACKTAMDTAAAITSAINAAAAQAASTPSK